LSTHGKIEEKKFPSFIFVVKEERDLCIVNACVIETEIAFVKPKKQMTCITK